MKNTPHVPLGTCWVFFIEAKLKHVIQFFSFSAFGDVHVSDAKVIHLRVYHTKVKA
jgi:hypothetical protein